MHRIKSAKVDHERFGALAYYLSLKHFPDVFPGVRILRRG
jgi:hypothetical protein